MLPFKNYLPQGTIENVPVDYYGVELVGNITAKMEGKLHFLNVGIARQAPDEILREGATRRFIARLDLQKLYTMRDAWQFMNHKTNSNVGLLVFNQQVVGGLVITEHFLFLDGKASEQVLHFPFSTLLAIVGGAAKLSSLDIYEYTYFDGNHQVKIYCFEGDRFYVYSVAKERIEKNHENWIDVLATKFDYSPINTAELRVTLQVARDNDDEIVIGFDPPKTNFRRYHGGDIADKERIYNTFYLLAALAYLKSASTSATLSSYLNGALLLKAKKKLVCIAQMQKIKS